MKRRELKARKTVNADRPFQFFNSLVSPVGDPPLGYLGQSLDPIRVAPAAFRDVTVVDPHVGRAVQERPVDARVVHFRHQAFRGKGEVLRPWRQGLLHVVLAIYRPFCQAMFSGTEVRVPQTLEAPWAAGIVEPRSVGRRAVATPPDGLLPGLGHEQLQVAMEFGGVVETTDITR